MPKVTEEHRTARRHEIVHAALRCFVRKGFQGTSMADIIAESGLSAGAIYGHYKSKDELIQMAASEVLEARFVDLEAARLMTPMPSPGAMVGTFVRGLEGAISDFGLLMQIWAQATVDPQIKTMASEVGLRLTSCYREYLLAWLTQDHVIPSVEAERRADHYAPLLMGLCQGYIVQAALFANFDSDAYLAAAAAITPERGYLS